MKKKQDFYLTISGFGLLGTFGANFIFLLWTWLFQPRMLGDGQYGMVFLFTSPLGWLAGSLLGLVRAFRNKNTARPRYSVLAGIGLVTGGVVATPLPGTLFMVVFCSLIGQLIERLKR